MSVSSRRWIRTLSALAIAAILLVLAGLVIQRIEKFNPPVTSVDSETVAGQEDDRAVGVYTGFEFVERVAGRKIFELLSKKTLGLSSGWHEIQGVKLKFFREGETGPILTCDGARFNIQTRDAVLDGSIRIEFPSGASLTTDAGKFEASSRRFTARSEVVFVSGATFGSAATATYDLANDEIQLDDGLILRTATGASMTAPRAVYRRQDGVISFPEGGSLTMGQSEIQAPLIKIELEANDGPPRRIELDGSGSSVVQLTGSADRITANASGSTQYLLFGLPVRSVDADLSGSSRIEVEVGDELVVGASGSSSVTYRGDPARVRTDTSGTSTVEER